MFDSVTSEEWERIDWIPAHKSMQSLLQKIKINTTRRGTDIRRLHISTAGKSQIQTDVYLPVKKTQHNEKEADGHWSSVGLKTDSIQKVNYSLHGAKHFSPLQTFTNQLS